MFGSTSGHRCMAVDPHDSKARTHERLRDYSGLDTPVLSSTTASHPSQNKLSSVNHPYEQSLSNQKSL